MNRNRWLGTLAAITALVVGMFAYAGIAAAEVGPDITGTGGGTYTVGTSFNYQTTAGVSANAFTGYNLGVVYPSSSAGGNLTQGGIFDDAAGAFGGTPICGTTIDDDLAGALPAPLRADIIGCVYLGGASIFGPTPLGHVAFTGIAPGVAAAHMICVRRSRRWWRRCRYLHDRHRQHQPGQRPGVRRRWHLRDRLRLLRPAAGCRLRGC